MKSVENKGFPGDETVWTTVSASGYFVFKRTMESGLLRKMAENGIDVDIGGEDGVINRMLS